MSRFDSLARQIRETGKTKSWRRTYGGMFARSALVSYVDLPRAVKVQNNTWAYFEKRCKHFRALNVCNADCVDETRIAIQFHNTQILTLHQNGEIEIASGYDSFTTRQRHKSFNITLWSDVGETYKNRIPVVCVHRSWERIADHTSYRSIIFPFASGIVVDSSTLDAFWATPEAFFLNLGMRLGDVASCEKMAMRVRELGYPDFADAILANRGEKFGHDRRETKRKFDTLDDAHSVPCAQCGGSGKIHDANTNVVGSCGSCDASGSIFSHVWLLRWEDLESVRLLSNRDVLLKDAVPTSEETTIDGVRYALASIHETGSPSEDFINRWLDKHARTALNKEPSR